MHAPPAGLLGAGLALAALAQARRGHEVLDDGAVDGELEGGLAAGGGGGLGD